MYIYIYIYYEGHDLPLHGYHRRAGLDQPLGRAHCDGLLELRATCYTPEITKVKLHGKMPLRVHWKIPVDIHWTSGHLLEHTAEQCERIGTCHRKSIGKRHGKSTTISEVPISCVQSCAP